MCNSVSYIAYGIYLYIYAPYYMRFVVKSYVMSAGILEGHFHGRRLFTYTSLSLPLPSGVMEVVSGGGGGGGGHYMPIYSHENHFFNFMKKTTTATHSTLIKLSKSLKS